MHKFYIAMGDLRDKKYEKAANGFYEFIFDDEFKNNVDKAIKELEGNGKLQLSIQELTELHEKAKKYFENKINNLVAEAYFDLGVISIFTNQKEYNPRYTKNKYLDKAFELSKNIDILKKLGIVYGKHDNKKSSKCFEKIQQINPNDKKN
ncbi:hypothetical protein [Brachyspira catarrhinii]|uniref:Tetratricopeptide repeat protein n=1 Tax=Brachyspira catarrhinii TaxID=2528966 RepID=A0ABY2TTJ1_9SPIR|nr:hypothetical protein [Brachyspira catarrhinii]TKZ35501.1 hypothetical protein EZH24_04920 [Brachyspira catarrhinii]